MDATSVWCVPRPDWYLLANAIEIATAALLVEVQEWWQRLACAITRLMPIPWAVTCGIS